MLTIQKASLRGKTLSKTGFYLSSMKTMTKFAIENLIFLDLGDHNALTDKM